MNSKRNVDLKVRAIDDWAARELRTLKQRKLSYIAGSRRDKGATAALKRKAVLSLLDCSTLGSQAPIGLVALIAELMETQLDWTAPDFKGWSDNRRKWEAAIRKAGEYPEPPNTNLSRENPKKRASMAELLRAAGVSRNTMREWLSRPQFLRDYSVERRRRGSV